MDGNTTWKHQHAYAKMLIAGSLNQARRIIEKYDDVLYGPAPEELVGTCHHEIRKLISSEECRNYLEKKDCTDKASVDMGDKFIKKIVEAVSPILPITLRNKALDGSYLRTGLHLLGAAEFLFTHLESDVRGQANPAGMIGMCTAMHAELERSAIWNEELSNFRDFMKEMKAQYQTCFGLGKSFLKDSKRRSRNTQGRSSYRNPHFQNQGFGLMHNQFPVAGGRGGGMSTGMGRGLQDIASLRSRGICFNFRAGSCGRGTTCKFLHTN